jgi:hypothetical protein
MEAVHEACADSVGTGAPETEIEITPDMIEAGVREFCGYDPRFEQPEDIVPEIQSNDARFYESATIFAGRNGFPSGGIHFETK